MKNARFLAVALIAIFALSAVGATAAFGEGEKDEFEGNGKESISAGVGVQLFTTTFGKVECKKLDDAAKGIIVAPTVETTSVKYSECKAFGVKATINFGTCQYKFEKPVDLQTEAEEELAKEVLTKHSVSVSIVNCKGTPIKIENTVCEVTVPEQTLKGITALNEGEPGKPVKTKASAKVTGIEYTGLNATCPNIKKAPETLKNGEYVGEFTATNIWIN